MAKEKLLFNQVDPEVLEAHDTSEKLIGKLWQCTDPLMKKIFKEMAFDALDYEAELRLRTHARQEVKKLREIQNPRINLN